MSEEGVTKIDTNAISYFYIALSDEQLQQLAVYIAEHLIKRG